MNSDEPEIHAIKFEKNSCLCSAKANKTARNFSLNWMNNCDLLQ